METFTYTIRLEPAEEGGYTVTVPELPAIVTEGDTYEEALSMAQDAISAYIGSLVQDGRPIPVEKQGTEALAARVQVAAPATV